MASTTTTYPDSLFFNALLAKIEAATSFIEIATFLFRTDYVSETRAHQIAEALKAAAGRGVRVYVVLSYSRFEPEVSEDNYATGSDLAAAGCRVRMAPRNKTMHTKLAIIDLIDVFLGSHNLTRGALSFNNELTVYSNTKVFRQRGTDYFNKVWDASTPIEAVEPPVDSPPVVIELLTTATTETGVDLTFSVNHTDGVDAFAAIAAPFANLTGATMGESVPPEARVASVTPTVAEGDPVFVAVRAYASGAALATSPVIQIAASAYEPPAPPDEPPADPPADPDTPPPMPFGPPTLQSVTQVGPQNITVVWFWIGPAGFHRFVIQQRDATGDWTTLATSFDQTPQEWTGPALSLDSAQTVRVVVYNMEEEWQASDELPITLEGSVPGTLQAPVILHAEIYESGGDLYIVWSWEDNTPEPPFDHFAIQQMDGMGTWQTRVTLPDSTTQNWTGAPLPVPPPRHFRVVAVDTMGGEAASDSVEVAG